jgi:hypothetical protein
MTIPFEAQSDDTSSRKTGTIFGRVPVGSGADMEEGSLVARRKRMSGVGVFAVKQELISWIRLVDRPVIRPG